MTRRRARVALVIAFALTVLFAGTAVAFAAPTIPAGFGWADGPHGSYPGYCLNCHTGFAVAPPTITAGATAPHGDRGSTCTQCHTVVTPPPADTTKPTTTSDAVASYTGSATIHLTGTDNTGGSGVASTHYKLDGGTDTVGTTVSTTVVGSHTLVFWSVDKAGNVEAQKTATFSIVAPAPTDTVAPATTSDAVATYTTSAAIHLTATDAGSGVASTHYRLDGGTDTVGTTVSTTALGSHTLVFWSIDKVGNVEAQKTASFTVVAPAPTDAVAPTTASDAVATYTTSAAIHLTATDNTGGSGVASTHYRLDGGIDTVGTTVSTTVVGSHTLVFWSVDKAGNVEAAKTVNFAVAAAPTTPPSTTTDTVAPVTTSNAKTSYRGSAVITLKAADAGAGVYRIYYRLDGGKVMIGTRISVAKAGRHTLEFWSVDKAGNIEKHHIVRFSISRGETENDSRTARRED
jgi:hypothetical protein